MTYTQTDSSVLNRKERMGRPVGLAGRQSNNIHYIHIVHAGKTQKTQHLTGILLTTRKQQIF